MKTTNTGINLKIEMYKFNKDNEVQIKEKGFNKYITNIDELDSVIRKIKKYIELDKKPGHIWRAYKVSGGTIWNDKHGLVIPENKAIFTDGQATIQIINELFPATKILNKEKRKKDDKTRSIK